MKRTVIGAHTGPGFHYDLRDGFRMGDFACVYYCLLQWRNDNPSERLYILWDPHHYRSHYAKQLPLPWVFEGIADEIWETTRNREALSAPNAASLRPAHHWDDWFKLRKTRTVVPSIRPQEEYLQRAHELLLHASVPERFVLYQPLMDAGYHHYRNAPPEWWSAVLAELADKAPTVLVAPPGWSDKLKIPANVFAASSKDCSPLTSMALSSMSAVHCGGETGLPLWASLFKVPVVAMFRHWKSYRDSRRNNAEYDYMPMDCGAPVVFAQLETDPAAVAAKIVEVYEGRGVSTPMDPDPVDIPAGGLWPRRMLCPTSARPS